jgi:hypothetical protein
VLYPSYRFSQVCYKRQVVPIFFSSEKAPAGDGTGERLGGAADLAQEGVIWIE